MPRPRPDEPQKILSVQIKESAAQLVEDEARERGVPASVVYRELLVLGMTEYQNQKRKKARR